MADVFMSYAREDRDVAESIAGALEREGISVWWDRKIQVGRSFSQTIERELASAKCVVVLWSRVSVGSDWVSNEAADGASRQILAPILIDDVVPPLEFRRLQAAKLLGHDAIADNDDWPGCTAAIRAIIGGVASESASVPAPRKRNSARRRSRFVWLAGALTIAIVAASLLWLRRPPAEPEGGDATATQTTTVAAPTTASEAPATASEVPATASEAPAAPVPNHYYRLQWKGDGQYLDAVYCSKQLALNPGSDFDGGSCELFRFVPAGDGWSGVQLMSSGLFLGACSGNVALEEAHTGADPSCQLWQLVRAGDGWSRLVLKQDRGSLAPGALQMTDGAPVIGRISADPAGADQLWRIVAPQ